MSDGSDHDPEVYSCHFPPELITKILDYKWMGIREKRKGRLISPFWRSVIDARPEIVFNVKLNNETAKWVQNTNASFIQSLRVEGLTKEIFEYKIFQTKPPKEIVKVIIGAKNSRDNFWKILQLCDDLNIECLEFEQNSIPTLEENSDWLRLREISPSVNSLVIETGDFKNDIEAENICSFLDGLTLPSLEHLVFKINMSAEWVNSKETESSTSDCNTKKNHVLIAFYDFLNRHTSIRKLELSIYNRDNCSWMPDLKDSLVSCGQIEELSLEFDFCASHDVYPLIQNCKELKILKISQSEFCKTYSVNLKAPSALHKLTSQNATTLESLSIKSNFIRYSKIGLEKCTHVKTLKLFMNSFRFNQSRRISSPVENLEIGYGGDGTFSKIKNFLEFTAKELQEVTVNFSPGFDILDLQWILDSARFPKLRKVIVSGMPSNVPPLIARHCDETPGIKAVWICGNDGQRDFCITKN